MQSGRNFYCLYHIHNTAFIPNLAKYKLYILKVKSDPIN